MTPTEQQTNTLQELYNYYNAELFKGELPNIILSLSRAGSAHTGGFFAPSRWVGKNTETKALHEISLSPETLRKEPKTIVSILVHEMVHLWQHEYGKPSRSCYHNSEWADKMESIGLMPSDTGEKGGKRTGQQITHYIIENGKFEKAYEKMDKNLLLPFEHVPLEQKKTKNKTKYICVGCGAKVWGKEKLRIKCKDCGKEFLADN